MGNPRNMARVYRYNTTEALLELRSRKLCKARRLEKSYAYLDLQELRRIRFNINQIEVELESRKLQIPLFS